MFLPGQGMERKLYATSFPITGTAIFRLTRQLIDLRSQSSQGYALFILTGGKGPARRGWVCMIPSLKKHLSWLLPAPEAAG